MATTQKYQVTVNYLTVKNKKNIFSSTIGTLKNGDIVEVSNINWLWATIIYNNQSGYVYAYGLTKYVEQTKGSVTIQYIDSTTGTKIQDDESNTNLTLGSYSYSAKTISGYTLSSSQTVSVTLTQSYPNQTIIFKYDKIYGSVTIQYLASTEVLLLEETYSGLELGAYSYSAKDISGYTLTSNQDVSVTLTEEAPNQTITFTYEKIYGSVTIQYLAGTDVLLSEETYSGLELGTYSYSAKQVAGYKLNSSKEISVTLTEDNSNQTITFTYEKIYGSVTIQYLSGTEPLLPKQNYSGLELGTYSYSAKSVTGYQLTSSQDISVTLTDVNPNQTITFTYEKIYGSVTIQYLAGTQALLPEETYSGVELGTYSYFAKQISGYKLISNQAVPVTLTETNPHQTITFTYEKIYGSVTIQYIDTDLKVMISQTETHSQLNLTTYTYEAPIIDSYQLITTTPITVTLTIQEPNQTIIFEYKKEEETEFLPLDESLQNEVPYISTYYIKPIVAPGEEVVIDYYITDYYHKEYTDDDYSDTFIVTVHIEDYPDIILRNLKAGDHSVSLGSFTLEREQKFSILCTDQYGRNSHELFNFFLVRTEPAVKEYLMTEEDLVTYNIKNKDDYEELLEVPITLETVNATTVKEALTSFASTYTPRPNTYTCFLPKTSDTDDPAKWWASIVTKYADDYDKTAVATQSQNTRTGLQQLLDDLSAQGYNKLKLLPGTYRIDHTGTIYIPTKFTLDLNQATIKLNQFTGNSALMITLNNTFDSHVINGTIEGDFYSHDYAASPNNSEWVNGISIGGEAKYSSFESLTIKNITGYGSTNGIANSRDGSLGYTYLSPRSIGNNFNLGDIDQTTGLDIISSNRTTSDFRDISGYSELGYLTISVYLGYQGNPCGTWNLIAHFYDINKNYITSTSAYQYRRIGVPKNAKYLRVIILNESYPTNLSIQLFRIPTHCSFQNCNHDNCRCVGMAPNAMNDMFVNNCDFTRCGWSSAQCALDAEDGWDMMQDVTFKGLNFYTNPSNDFLTCAGHNFIANECSGKMYIWGRTRNIVIKHCNMNGNRIHHDGGVKTGEPRITNTKLNGGSIAGESVTFRECTGYPMQYSQNINCDLTYFTWNGNYTNCTFSLSSFNGYITQLIADHCTFKNCDSSSSYKLSFNSYNSENKVTNSIFTGICNLASHNQFNSGYFYNCTFENLILSPNMKQTGSGEIIFDHCTLNKIFQYTKAIDGIYQEVDGGTKIIFKDCNIL